METTGLGNIVKENINTTMKKSHYLSNIREWNCCKNKGKPQA